jgi:hypothetical protein
MTYYVFSASDSFRYCFSIHINDLVIESVDAFGSEPQTELTWASHVQTMAITLVGTSIMYA